MYSKPVTFKIMIMQIIFSSKNKLYTIEIRRKGLHI